jgi:hypothetical protein
LTTPEDKILFYPVWVSSSGRVSLRWGKPCDTPGEARRAGKEAIARGEATTAFVVRFADGKKEPMPSFTSPELARRVVEHWELLWDATE